MSRWILGVTGGIGSGKTAVTDRFGALGITIVDADLASRAVVEPGSEALAQIAAHFGRDILNPDGTLNRAALRAIVFADEAELRILESITHPAINTYLANGLASAESIYAILVSPILIEAKQDALVNRVLVVDVPEHVQIERTMARDDNSEEQVRRIIAQQIPRDARLARADDVIVNDRGLDHLDQEVARLHASYVNMATGIEE